MKIKTRLRITTTIAIGVALFMVLALGWSYRLLSQAEQNEDLVSEIRKLAAERIVLRDDYVIRQEDRAWTQWVAKTGELGRVLQSVEEQFPVREDRAVIKEAKDDLNVTFLAFSYYRERRMADKVSGGRNLLPDETEGIILGQVIMKAYALQNDIERLYRSAEKASSRARIRVGLVVVLFVIASVAVVIFNTTMVGRIVTRGITALGTGTSIISQGNLEHRIEVQGDDEFSDLARASNDMAGKLSRSYTSVVNLQEEIAERKRVEEELRSLSLRNEAILDSVPDIIMEVDKNRVYRWSNKAGVKFFGEDAIGKEAQFYFEGKEDVYSTVQPIFEGDENIVYIESWQRRKDGEKRLLAWWCRGLKDGAGNVAGALSSARDITNHKRAEEALRASEEKYRTLFDSAGDAIFIHDTEGRILAVNAMACEHYGYTQSELLSMNVAMIDTPEQSVHSSERITKLLEQGMLQFETMHGCKDGTPISVDVKARKITWNDQPATMSICRDITERKRAEEALRDNQARLDFALQAASMGVWHWDILENRRYFDEQVFNLMGINPSTFTGAADEFFGAVHPDDRESIKAALARTLAQGGLYEPEYRVNWPDGSVHYITSRGRLVHDDKGRPIRLYGILWDITERKRAEELLRETETRYRLLFEHSPDGIVILDPVTARFLDFNETAHRQLGYSREEFARISIGDVEARETAVETKERIAGVIRDGKADFDTLQRTRQGEIRNVHVTAQIVDIKGHPVYHCIWRDITEQRRLEEQLRHAQKMEAIGTLAGGVAHDFNNILNVIMGYGSLVLDKMEPDNSSREEMHEVLAAAERAVTLTKRLLVFSRKQVVDVKPVEVNGIISGVQKMLSRIIGEDIELQVNLADRRMTVMADAAQIEQVLMNLATNARDGMPKGGRLTIATEAIQMDDAYIASHGYGHPGAYAVITVADIGKGMDAETQTKIFEPFFTTKGISEGTGLGLAISYGIINQHQGYIKCYSELNRGTVFKIYLPLIEESAASIIQAKAAGSIQGGTETILAAEDDPSLRKLTRVVLESFGYGVIMAVDGEDAVAKFMQNRDTIKLVILDLVMPKKSGKDVYEEIKKASPGIRTFFLSGYSVDMISRMELEQGMELLRKPFVPKDLLKKVREVLDR